jgi:hypothetical protein
VVWQEVNSRLLRMAGIVDTGEILELFNLVVKLLDSLEFKQIHLENNPFSMNDYQMWVMAFILNAKGRVSCTEKVML